MQSNDRSPQASGFTEPLAGSPPWQRRITTSFWGFADQAVVSFGNFATVLLLGRKLSPAALGTYGVILGIMLALNNLQGSLITYPLSVHGATSDWGKLRRLTWMSVLLTAMLLVPMAIGIAGLSYAMRILQLAPWIISVLVFWQIQETLRRGLMSQLRYRDALWGDLLSYLGQAVVVAILVLNKHTDLRTIFSAMALTSIAGAIVQWMQIRPVSVPAHDLMLRARDCWDLGRWTTLSNVAGLMNVQAVLWMLALTHGTAEAGKLLALGTILGLTHPAIFSVANQIVPAAAGALRSGGVAAVLKIGLTYGAIGGLLVIPYYLLLIVKPALALRIFYGAGSPYLFLQPALRIFAVTYIASYLCMVQSSLLNGMARSRSSLLIQLAMVAVTLCITMPLAAFGGVLWSLAGACTSMFAGLLVGSVLLRGSIQTRQKQIFATDDPAQLSAAA